MCCYFFYILRVHYEWEMDCFTLQNRVSTLFRWGGYIFFTCVCNVFSCLHQCKNYENRVCLLTVIITNILPRFLLGHSVFAYSLWNVRWATMTVKGRSNPAALPLDRFRPYNLGLRPWLLTVWPWSVICDSGSRYRHFHQVWRSYASPLAVDYDTWHMP